MHKIYDSLEALLQQVVADKSAATCAQAERDRYPIRFVLFDNFVDAYEFISVLQNQRNVKVESVSSWLDSNYEDIIITNCELAEKIRDYVHSTNQRDSVISPFSELARFYNNEKSHFNTLIVTLKSIEATTPLMNKQRVYIPIVGLYNKMSKFFNDSQITVWYYKSTAEHSDYKLILTNGHTYDVQSIDEHYTIISTVYEWLDIWKDRDVKSQIILTSPAIFTHAKYAQPDNAFSYTTCSNVYEFLTLGLNLTFPNLSYDEKHNSYWERLATKININNFSLDDIIKNCFQCASISNAESFFQVWLKCHDDFERWLLTKYYTSKQTNPDYLSLAISKSKSLNNSNFYASILLTIFELDSPQHYYKQRLVLLKALSVNSITIPAHYLGELRSKLISIASAQGVNSALSYFSTFSNTEKKILIDWLSEGYIQPSQLKNIYPELYYYLDKTHIKIPARQSWVIEYCDLYKQAKIKNEYTQSIGEIIKVKNQSEVTFFSWYEDFKSLKSLFNGRSDIEIYYWIDGLGIEWISYINWLLQNLKENHIYLNEVHIARAIYPTTTNSNKPILQAIARSNLLKQGDLDSLAHNKESKLPHAIIEELNIVKSIFKKIENEFSGKKIAIISDHGLTALSQLRSGLNLSGVESDHHGRVAIRTNEARNHSSDYIYCDDERTICALKHESLCAKVATGQSVHGGCTPEEILVPVFIISPHKEQKCWKALLITNQILAVTPTLKFEIKGLTNDIEPYIRYNNKSYSLHKNDGDIFESNRIDVIKDESIVELIIGNSSEEFSIDINLGVEEDDLFEI